MLTGSGQPCHIGRPLSPPTSHRGIGISQLSGSLTGPPDPRRHFDQKTKPTSWSLSLSCSCENRKLISSPPMASRVHLQTTPLPPCCPALLCPQPATAHLPPWPDGPQTRSHALFPEVTAHPAFYTGAAGRMLPDLCQSGKSDHFSLRFNFNFICKGFCHLDVWHTSHQCLYRKCLLGGRF